MYLQDASHRYKSYFTFKNWNGYGCMSDPTAAGSSIESLNNYLLGMWIALFSAARAASLIASVTVGCA